MIQAPPKQLPHRRANRPLVAVGVVVLLAAVAAVVRAKMGQGPARRMGPPAVRVKEATVVRKSVPLDLSIPGTVVPYASVSVGAMVGGQLQSVDFQQGKPVTRGQMLFTIDPRPFQAALSQQLAIAAKDRAQVSQLAANLSRDIVQRDNAVKEDQRYESLFKLHYVSREQADQYRVAAEAAQATVAADRAAVAAAGATVGADRSTVENAQINLGYTHISSPITGVAGNLQVDAGNLVKPNDATPLVTINQIEPIYVSFPLSEAQFAQMRRYRRAGRIDVTAVPADQPGATSEKGTFAFTDNTVDPTTGTIAARAVFPNADRGLWPGNYVQVSVHLADEPNCVVVPQAAVQTGQSGQYVYVIQPDDTVSRQPITVERDQGTEAVVTTGLSAGQQVVTDGQLELVNGAKVKIVSGKPAARGN